MSNSWRNSQQTEKQKNWYIWLQFILRSCGDFTGNSASTIQELKGKSALQENNCISLKKKKNHPTYLYPEMFNIPTEARWWPEAKALMLKNKYLGFYPFYLHHTAKERLNKIHKLAAMYIHTVWQLKWVLQNWWMSSMQPRNSLCLFKVPQLIMQSPTSSKRSPRIYWRGYVDKKIKEQWLPWQLLNLSLSGAINLLLSDFYWLHNDCAHTVSVYKIYG